MAQTQQFLKLRSSVVLFGGYEYECFRHNQLTFEFISLFLRKRSTGDTLSLQLSFKHINKVEFLDNSEAKGAGLILHVNDFMAQRIQDTLDKQGNDFINFRSSYAPNNFIVLDLLNCDTQTVTAIRKTLHLCEDFHRRYVIDMCNKAQANGQDKAQSLSTQYICPIYFNQWKALLGSMQKDIFFEYMETILDGQKTLRYTVGKICNYMPSEVYSLQQDGSLVSRKCVSNENNFSVAKTSSQTSMNGRSENLSTRSGAKTFATTNHNVPVSPAQFLPYEGLQDSGHTPNPNRVHLSSTSINSGSYLRQNQSQLQSIRYVVHSQHQSSYFQQFPNSEGIDASSSVHSLATPSGATNLPVSTPYNLKKSPSSLRRHTTTPLTHKREVHVIEDEDDSTSDALASKRPNDTVFIYPTTGGGLSCSVHYSDLKYLDHNYMLNDTIIDFYLKYIYHEFIPENRRNKIFMFNSFFYSRLAQPPSNVRVPLSMSTRLKRIQTNFQFVKSWTKRVNLFEKDYIIVPINEDIHWYLAVIVNPKAGIIPFLETPFSSKKSDVDCTDSINNQKNHVCTRASTTSSKPYVIVFDSLIENDRKHAVVKELLGEYLTLEFDDKRTTMSLSGHSFNKLSLKLITPIGVPQQKNYVDCGVFLLQFAEIFMTNPPKNLSPCVSFSSWYPKFYIKGKREAIKSIIRKIASNVKYADFLPRPVSDKKSTTKSSGKKALTNLETLMMQPVRTRRHSDSSLLEMEKESQFTSIGLNSCSRSLESLMDEIKDMPPVVLTFCDQLRNNKRRSLSGIRSVIKTI